MIRGVSAAKRGDLVGRTILFVGGARETIAGVERAKELGLSVAISDANPDAPAMALADHRLVASTYDIDATIQVARDFQKRERRIDGVICVATDVPVTVAAVAAALGLPGIPVESARLSADKMAMKERFKSAGVPTARFQQVSSWEQVRSLAGDWGFPLILKPVDSRGARGVLRLSRESDLEAAFAESRSNSPTSRVMLEEFLEGDQVSSESFILDGIAHTPGLADRNYEFLERFAPRVIENGGDLPSRIDARTRTEVNRVVQRAAASLGVVNGVIKGDIVIAGGKVQIIEVATRLSGGYFCTHEIPFNTGVDFVGAALRMALGEVVRPADLRPTVDRPIVSRYLFPSPGTVTSISGVEHFQDHPDVLHLEVRVNVGDQVAPLDSHPARAGVVLTTGSSREAAIALANEVTSGIRIQTRAGP